MMVYGIEVTKSDRIEFLAEDLLVKLSREQLQFLIDVLSDEPGVLDQLLNLLVLRS